jgi:hypothetical protein
MRFDDCHAFFHGACGDHHLGDENGAALESLTDFGHCGDHAVVQDRSNCDPIG